MTRAEGKPHTSEAEQTPLVEDFQGCRSLCSTSMTQHGIDKSMDLFLFWGTAKFYIPGTHLEPFWPFL